jgi:pimeloyl-ACP methyl ester carboxylesterase
MHIRHDDIDLHVAEDGDPSAPPILLLHGITSSTHTWDWIVPTLAERFRVLRLDFRGHGDSARAPGAYLPDDYVGDAVAALQQVAGVPAAVVGHSLGGATAAALAQRHPGLLTAAFMEDPPLGAIEPAAAVSLEGHALLDGFRLMRESIPQLQSSGIALTTLVGILAAAPDASGATFGDLLLRDGIESMAAGLLACDATVLDPVLAGEITTFLDPTLPLAVPSTIVTADPARPDAVCDPAVAEHYRRTSPDVVVHTVAGAGHLVHDERSSRETFRSALVDFVDRLPSPAR